MSKAIELEIQLLLEADKVMMSVKKFQTFLGKFNSNIGFWKNLEILDYEESRRLWTMRRTYVTMCHLVKNIHAESDL